MNLLNLSWPTFGLGLLGLAGLLFALQRLRVRYREQTVVTTMFWKEALEEARARVLVRRFRHLPAYLLVLLICGLMWLGFADPSNHDGSARQQLILLDGSATMAPNTRFAQSVELLDRHLRSLPDARRRLVLCADSAQTLLAPGESSLLLEARLEGVTPAACPPSVEATLRDLLTGIAPDQPTTITLVADTTISQTTVDALPAQTRLQRLMPPAAPPGVHAIESLGVARAGSGAWDRVDVLCTIRGTAAAQDLHTTLDGQTTELIGQRQSPQDDFSRIVFADLPANGQVFAVELSTGDDARLDNRAAIRLPQRQHIRVQILDAELRPALLAALAADPAVRLSADDPDVVIAGRSAVDADQPALRFVPVDTQADTVVIHHRDNDARQVLAMFRRLGITEVDAMDAAQATGRNIAIGAASTQAARQITMWDELLQPRFNFVQSRSFPLFVARSVRWLARVTESPAFIAAGVEAPLVRTPRRDAAGRRLDPVGAAFVPPAAGSYRHADGTTVVAALLATDPSEAGASIAELRADDGGSGLDWGLAVALAVLLLLLAEWYWLTNGRMP